MNKKSNKNRFVNWVDGMKINKSHFIQTDIATQSLIEQLGLAVVSDTKYGLLPLPDADRKDQKSLINVEINARQEVVVQITGCKAITRGGLLIDISQEDISLLNEGGVSTTLSQRVDAFSNNESILYILLNISTDEYIPVGEFIDKEHPPRHPFLLPKFSLSFIEEKSLSKSYLGANYLMVGKLILDSVGNPVLDEYYIPPCYSVQSHEDLAFIHVQCVRFFVNMEKYCLKIIQKIRSKKQTNPLAEMVLEISNTLWKHISVVKNEYEEIDAHRSGVFMVTKFSGIASLLRNHIDMFIGSGKEELITYFVSWTDYTQVDFERLVDNTADITYKHHDINEAVETIKPFIQEISALFKKLDELDFIGQKDDSGIFVKEEVVVKQDVKQRRRFLFDD